MSITFQLFPKLFQSLSLEELMETCRSLNFDAPTVMVREGYWVQEQDLERSLTTFVRTAERYGMTVDYAQTGLHMPALEPDNPVLQALAAAGIKQVRLGMIPKDVVPDYRQLPDFFARAAAKAEEAGRRNNIRCVIQIHGNLYPHNATAVWPMVRDLDPKYIGVKLDPGNNFCFEGYERFDYQIRLLREYITAVGVKDAAVRQRPGVTDGGKGWYRQFVPITQGLANYELIVEELLKVGFDGPMVFMPFYEMEPKAFLAAVKEEVAYLRAIVERKQAEREGGSL